MFWRPQFKPLSIGLDLEGEGVRMLQLGIGPANELVALAAAYDATLSVRGDGAASVRELSVGLTHMLRQGRFIGKDVVVAMPREAVKHKSIRVPPMESQELGGAMEFEAKTLFDATPDTHVIDYVPMGQVRQAGEAKQEVLVAAAPRGAVDELVERLHHAGVRTVAVDFEPCVLYRTVERFVRRKDDEQEVHVILEVGLEGTSVLIGRGRELCFYRPLAIGTSQIWQAIARKLGIDKQDAQSLSVRLGSVPEDQIDSCDDVRQAVFDASRPIVDELAREVSLCLRYATVTFRGLRPLMVRLTGLGSDDFVVRDVLSRSLPIAVEPSRPIMNADLSRLRAAERSGNLSAWTIALGLALRDAPGGLAARMGVSRSGRASAPSTGIDPEQAIPAEIVPGPVQPEPASTSKPAPARVVGPSEVLSA